MHVTEDSTLKRDLRASLAFGKPVTTIGDLLNVLMALRLTLDTPIASIEFGIKQRGSRRLHIEDTDEGIEIREL